MDKELEQIDKLMRLVTAESALDFCRQYAQEHPEFRSAWLCWLEQKYLPQGNSPDDVRKTVEAVFNAVPLETRRCGSLEDEVLDWYALGESMLHLIANIAKEPLPTRLGTVLEFLRQLNSYKDFGIEDDWMEVEDIVCQMQHLIASYLRCGDMAKTDKKAAVDLLAEIAALPLYRDKGMGDLDALLTDFSLEVLDEDAALRMLDDQIAKADELYREEPILRKCEYLLQLGRNTEAEELLHRYCKYDDVRRKLVEMMAGAGRYDELMRELDAAVREEEGRPYGAGLADVWRELQCHYAAQFKDKARLEQLLCTLFRNSGGGIKYYNALRKVIPANRRNDCLEGLIGKVLEMPEYDYMALGEIFLREKQPQRVVDAAPRDCEECLYFVCHFAPKLKDISGLLHKFTAAAGEFVKTRTDRKAYRRLADFMGMVAKLPGGRECMQALVSEFRSLYPRRSAMMDELKRF